MTYGSLLDRGEKLLSLENIRDSKADAWLMLEYVTHMDRGAYYLHIGEEAEENVCREYFELIEKRKTHIPLQYITGHQEFMGFDFMVNPSVLIPRQDTEILVEKTLPFVKGKAVLDICTGSGCIAVSLKLLGNPCSVTASDKSEDALYTAGLNAKNLNADVKFIKSDLFENIEGSFDVIVSNPPYISEEEMRGLEPEVKVYEPSMALWGGADGLYFYRRITDEAGKYLNPGGRLFFEIGCSQADSVGFIMAQKGYKDIEVIKDYAGLDRVVMGRL